MRYPTLQSKQVSLQTIDSFAGYNHNLRIGDNEFYDMQNMTSDKTPLLSVRKQRGVYLAQGNIQGMIAKDSLCYIDGSDFVMNQYRVDMGLSTEPEACPKQMISMGAYVIILPDKKYINTADITDHGDIEASFTSTSAVTFTMCNLEGEAYTPDYIQSDEPGEPSNMQLWLDTSVTPHSLKQFSASSGIWTGIATTYVRIHSVGIGKGFDQYDGVTISGLSGTLENEQGQELEDPSQIQALNGQTILYAAEDDAITVVGILDAPVTIVNPISVSRKMPLMDFVIEKENRLWGCRYGLNAEGAFVNELYACKLGDFKNWNCFMGISTDSYVVSLGSDGQFTGAVTHAGYPLFFKEDCMHKVYGQIPSNFQVQTTQCRGVQRGSSRSMAIVNEILYYKAKHGVCAYDGSLPTEVSSALGDVWYQNGVGTAYANKYYISMERADSTPELFVYDTAKGLWHKEDSLKPYLLCGARDEIYCATEEGKILTLLGSGSPGEETLPWFVETGIWGVTMPNAKYLNKILIRMQLDAGSFVSIQCEYDSSGQWEDLGFITGMSLKSFSVPVRPRRCDHLRLRLSGEGNATIFSITKSTTQGSDTP